MTNCMNTKLRRVVQLELFRKLFGEYFGSQIEYKSVILCYFMEVLGLSSRPGTVPTGILQRHAIPRVISYDLLVFLYSLLALIFKEISPNQSVQSVQLE